MDFKIVPRFMGISRNTNGNDGKVVLNQSLFFFICTKNW